MSVHPFVSLILPIRNEADYIERSLGAILEQDYPGEMEILIADGMSTDGTRQIILELARQYPQYSVSILDNPGKIVPVGMNVALRQARGEIIIRVDGHTLIASDYVSQCVEALHFTKADNVGGRMNALGYNTFGNAVAFATSTPFGVGGARFHYSDNEEWVDTVYLGAWFRRIFEEVGLFDEELVRDQDDEFNYRLREHGRKILLSPLIRSEYFVRSSPSALWNQYFQYGCWKVRVLQKHPFQMHLRQFVPPAFVVSYLFSAVLLFFSLPCYIHPAFWSSILYLGVNLSVSFYIAAKNSWKYLRFLPVIFIILHIGYGLGFLVGLLKFWNRWGDRIGKTPVWSFENN